MEVLEFALFFAVCAMLVITYLSMARHPFDAVALYVYLFALLFVGRPFILMLGLDTPVPDYLLPSNMQEVRTYAITAVLLWCMGFYLNHWIRMYPRALSRMLPTAPTVVFRFRMLAVCVFFLMASLAVIGFLIARYGLDLGAITFAVRLERIFAGYSFVLVFGVLGAYLWVAFGYMHVLNQRSLGRPFPVFVFSITMLLSAVCIVGSILFADRDNVAFWFVFVVMGFSMYVRRVPFLLMLPFGGVAIWLLVYLKYLRFYLWDYQATYKNVLREIISALNLNSYDNFLLLISYRQKETLRWGEDFALGFLGVIPRSVWPEKPAHLDPGIWLSNQFIPGAVYGWPISVVGEWWFNFGLVGVFVGGFASGFLYLMIAYRYQNFSANPLAFILVFIIAVRVMPMGYHTVSPMQFVLVLVPLIAVFLVLTSRGVLGRAP